MCYDTQHKFQTGERRKLLLFAAESPLFAAESPRLTKMHICGRVRRRLKERGRTPRARAPFGHQSAPTCPKPRLCVQWPHCATFET
jgi:hypothetical protein